MNRLDLFHKFVLKAPKGTDENLLRELANIVPSDAFDNEDRHFPRIVYLLGTLSDESESHAVIGHLEMSHQELASLHPIELRINCVGGDVYVAQGIIAKINELRRAGRKVNGHVVGYAWSAAFDILQACDYRTMESGASLMTHEEHMLPEGLLSSSEMGGIAAFSHKMERFAFAQWSKRTGRPVSYYVKQTKNREWWMSAEEALGEAFVDAVLPVPPFAENLATAPMKRTRPAADTDEDED